MRSPLAALLALAAAACGTQGPPGSAPPRPVATEESGIRLPAERDPDDYGSQHVPQFHVLTEAGDQLDLEPWTYCLPGVCADGGPSDLPPLVGSPSELEFGFDIAGWDFSWVTFREHGTRSMTGGYSCAREITVEAEQTGDRTFVIAPAGAAGDWDVDIFGRGPGGDAVTTVRWQTPTDGTFPEEASGQAAVLADHDGELDSYGVELSLRDLDRHYPDATARITVTSSEGNQLTIPLRGRTRQCYSEGSLDFGAGAALGREATSLGSGPFTYTAEVVLDGTTYTGTGVWPRDTHAEITPAVPLADWQPALPAYDGTR